MASVRNSGKVLVKNSVSDSFKSFVKALGKLSLTA